MLIRLLNFLRWVLRLRDHKIVDGSIVPCAFQRRCGTEFKGDHYFVRSAETEARRLVDHFKCTQSSNVLDVGCAYGRLPIGLIRVLKKSNYLGLDVDANAIDWCKRNIKSKETSFDFQFINVKNERYNSAGSEMDHNFKFALPDNHFDIIYLYSVFSHMLEPDIRSYLKEFSRILRSSGNVFFTTFVEENVPKVSSNPENYVFTKCSGPLHVVRYEKNYLFALLEDEGFKVQNFTHRTETDGQSALYLKKL
ncbi:MAG: class I SAM-dependent methyltransferase [Bdellovibrionales bacterium]|nr:class I SAM-dependent methyltransferase [Bdellovibrionales bacterium]